MSDSFLLGLSPPCGVLSSPPPTTPILGFSRLSSKYYVPHQFFLNLLETSTIFWIPTPLRTLINFPVKERKNSSFSSRLLTTRVASMRSYFVGFYFQFRPCLLLLVWSNKKQRRAILLYYNHKPACTNRQWYES